MASSFTLYFCGSFLWKGACVVSILLFGKLPDAAAMHLLEYLGFGALAAWWAGIAWPGWLLKLYGLLHWPSFLLAGGVTTGLNVVMFGYFMRYFKRILQSSHGLFSYVQAICWRMVTLGLFDESLEALKHDFAVDSQAIFGDGWQKCPEADSFKVPGRIHALDGNISRFTAFTEAVWRKPHFKYPLPHIVVKQYWRSHPTATFAYVFVATPHMVWTNMGSFVMANIVVCFAVYKIARWMIKRRQQQEIERKFSHPESFGSPLASTVSAFGMIPFVVSFFAKRPQKLDNIMKTWTTCAHLVDALDITTGKIAGNALKDFVRSIVDTLDLPKGVKSSLLYWFFFLVSFVLYLVGKKTYDQIFNLEFLDFNDVIGRTPAPPALPAPPTVITPEVNAAPVVPPVAPQNQQQQRPGHTTVTINHQERVNTNDGETQELTVNNFTVQFEHLIREIKTQATKTEAFVEAQIKAQNLKMEAFMGDQRAHVESFTNKLGDQIADLQYEVTTEMCTLKDELDEVRSAPHAEKFDHDKRSPAFHEQQQQQRATTPAHTQTDDVRLAPSEPNQRGRREPKSSSVQRKKTLNKGFVFGYEDFDPSKIDKSEIKEAHRIWEGIKTEMEAKDWSRIELTDNYNRRSPTGKPLTYGQVLANVETFLFNARELGKDELILSDTQVIDHWLDDKGEYHGPIRLKKAISTLGQKVLQNRAGKQEVLRTTNTEARKKRLVSSLAGAPPPPQKQPKEKEKEPVPTPSTSGTKPESINANNPYLTTDKLTNKWTVALHDASSVRRGHGELIMRTVNGQQEYYVATATHVLDFKPDHLITPTGQEIPLGTVARTNQDKCWIRISHLPTGMRPARCKVADPGTYHVIAFHQSFKAQDNWVVSTGTFSVVSGGNYPSEDGSSGMGVRDAVDMHCLGLHHGDRNTTTRAINLWDADDLVWMSGQGED